MTVYSPWHRSTYSGTDNNCVETRSAAHDDGSTEEQVQDSKNPGGGHLSFHPNQWAAFLDTVTPVRKRRIR
jgi:hypothetical protein